MPIKTNNVDYIELEEVLWGYDIVTDNVAKDMNTY